MIVGQGISKGHIRPAGRAAWLFGRHLERDEREEMNTPVLSILAALVTALRIRSRVLPV
jgi:hypothetical protein